MGVAVMGVGFAGAFPTSEGMSYRELIASAALMAYRDAGIDSEQIDGAVSVEEDFVSGYSIADEYVPDQLGVVRKPVYTICGDFLHGLGSAVMQIETGRFEMVVVEAYSKASNILLKDELLHFAFDPILDRLGVSPHYLGAVEMQRFLEETGYDIADAAIVVARNREAALANPAAAWGADTWPADVLSARSVATPVTESMLARHADGAVVVVLGSDRAAREHSRAPVAVTGTGWGSGGSIAQRRDHTTSVGTQIAAGQAFAEAGIAEPATAFELCYVSDLYPHRQLMHLDSLGLADAAGVAVNPDGGTLGVGDLIEANGGARLVDAVRQLRGEAGAHQIDGVERALVHGWRGPPTDSCAIAVLETERRTA
jgi:acetyl-CoA C-acetyltransferase